MMAYPSSASTSVSYYTFDFNGTATTSSIAIGTPFRVLKNRTEPPVYKEPESGIEWDEETRKFVYLKDTRWERSFSTKRSALKFLNRMNEGRKKKPDLLKRLKESKVRNTSPVVKKRKRMTMKDYVEKKKKVIKRMRIEQEELDEINEFLGRMGI